MPRHEPSKPRFVNPKVELELDLSDDEPLASMWFELVLGNEFDIKLYLGTNSGSRPVTQTLRISLSPAFCPFPELAELAERAVEYRLPFEFIVDSEGPLSAISLRPGPIEGAAIFAIRDYCYPALYFAAAVDACQFGMELAHALRLGIETRANRENWLSWAQFNEDNTAFDYFGNAWLRDVDIDNYPRNARALYNGVDQTNQQRYRR